jgi:glycosyltransferase involved in cell wall biosynthesis
MGKPLVTAILSAPTLSERCDERVTRGCLEGLLAQTLGGRLEILVIDSGLSAKQRQLVLDLQRDHVNIQYYRAASHEDPNGSFNRVIPIARGEYITRVSPDDRYRIDAFELMAAVLDQHPEFGIVYPDSLITNRENESFDATSARLRHAWPDYTVSAALTCPILGPHPLWRHAVHDHVGLFNRDQSLANDHDMYLRIARRFGAVHLRETLGLHRRRDETDKAQRSPDGIADVVRVLQEFRAETPLQDIFPELSRYQGDALARAAALFEMGNLCVLGPYADYQLALQFYRRATEIPGQNESLVQRAFFNNVACVFHCLGMKEKATSALDAAGDLPQAVENRRTLHRAEISKTQLLPVQLEFAEIPHPVVDASRKTRGLRLGHGRSIIWSEEREQVPWQVYDGINGVSLSDTELTSVGATRPHNPPDVGRHIMLVMYGWADSGGGTMLPRQVAGGLARRGHRVSVFYAGARPRPDLPAYGVLRGWEGEVELHGVFNRPATFMDLLGPEREADDPMVRGVFRDLLRDLAPDVVHFFNLHNLGMSLPRVCRDAGIPTVFSSNNYWPICPRLYLFDSRVNPCATGGAGTSGSACVPCLGNNNTAEAHAMRTRAAHEMLNVDLNAHLAVSQRVRDLYIHNGAHPDNITVLQQQPEHLDIIWERVGSKRQITQRLTEPLRVGFIGSLLPHKGVHVLVSALQTFPAGTVRGIVHGDAGPDYARLLKERDTNGVVEFGGAYSLDELPDRLAEMDIAVVPSVWEDCAPFVVAEALASRAPVLGSRAGGISDFIEDGETGFLFEPDNPNDLAQKILRFTQDPSLLGRMQSFIRAPRGFGAYLDDLLEVYGKVEEPSLLIPSTPIPSGT